MIMQQKLLKNISNQFLIDIKLYWKHQWEVVIWFLILIISCNKKNLNRGGSYIDSPDWIKNKIVTTNSINKKDSEYFHYANKVTLNHEEIGKHSQRITKIKPVIDQYNSEWIHYPSTKKKKKWLEKNCEKKIDNCA